MDDQEISRLKAEYRRQAAEWEAGRTELWDWYEARTARGAAPSGKAAHEVWQAWGGTLDEWERIRRRMKTACDEGMAAYRELRDAGLTDREIVA